jgi:iron-sulfur cluster assembly protein
MQRLELQAPVRPEPKRGDILVRSAGVAVLVDPRTALYLKGTGARLFDPADRGRLQVHNPNAKASCSCGESFSV